MFMATKLKEYFPMIREREEVLAEIVKSNTLKAKHILSLFRTEVRYRTGNRTFTEIPVHSAWHL